MLLSTCNLKMKGTPGKLQKRFVGPFRVTETIGEQAYRLALPEEWRIHPVFHVSLLRDWKSAYVQEDQPVSQGDAPKVEEPYWEIERLFRWRKIKRNKKIIKEYLVLWKGFPVEEASWVQTEQFSHPEQIQKYIEEDQPLEQKL